MELRISRKEPCRRGLVRGLGCSYPPYLQAPAAFLPSQPLIPAPCLGTSLPSQSTHCISNRLAFSIPWFSSPPHLPATRDHRKKAGVARRRWGASRESTGGHPTRGQSVPALAPLSLMLSQGPPWDPGHLQPWKQHFQAVSCWELLWRLESA